MNENKIVDKHEQRTAKADTLIVKTREELKNNIIAGCHLPGEKLRVEHLKHQYGVSSGTLREALSTLIADRLVIAEGQRGFRVKPVSVADLLDLNRIRIVLEKEAIRQSVIHGDDVWVGNVVASFHFFDQATKSLAKNTDDIKLFDEWARRHHAFHEALFSANPSDWAQYFLTISYRQFERYRYLFRDMLKELMAATEVRDAMSEHTEILNAALARDADLAATLLETHLQKTLDQWKDYFQKNSHAWAQAACTQTGSVNT